MQIEISRSRQVKYVNVYIVKDAIFKPRPAELAGFN